MSLHIEIAAMWRSYNSHSDVYSYCRIGLSSMRMESIHLHTENRSIGSSVDFQHSGQPIQYQSTWGMHDRYSCPELSWARQVARSIDKVSSPLKAIGQRVYPPLLRTLIPTHHTLLCPFQVFASCFVSISFCGLWPVLESPDTAMV